MFHISSMAHETMPDPEVISFLNAMTPRVGPVNAIGLLKDAQLNAFREILVNVLKVPADVVEQTVKRHLKQTAQGILQAPVPSPIQVQPLS